MEEGRLSCDSSWKWLTVPVYSCVHVCLKRETERAEMEYRPPVSSLDPERMVPIFPSPFPKDSGWKSWMNWAFGKEILAELVERAVQSRQNPEKVLNQIFFLSHSLDKLPSERQLGRLDLLVTTDCLVLKAASQIHTEDGWKYRTHDPKDTGLQEIAHISSSVTNQLVSVLAELSIYTEQEDTSVKVPNKKTLVTLGHLPTGLVAGVCFVFNQWLSPWQSPWEIRICSFLTTFPPTPSALLDKIQDTLLTWNFR